MVYVAREFIPWRTSGLADRRTARSPWEHVTFVVSILVPGGGLGLCSQGIYSLAARSPWEHVTFLSKYISPRRGTWFM